MPIPQADPRPLDNIQAHLLRASKFGRQPRDWSLFFFFRILTQAEMGAALLRLQDGPSAWPRVKMDLINPGLANAGLAEQGADGKPAATAFRNWLKVLVESDPQGLLMSAGELLTPAGLRPGAKAAEPRLTSTERLSVARTELSVLLDRLPAAPGAISARSDFDLRAAIQAGLGVLGLGPEAYAEVMGFLANYLLSEKAEAGPLPMLVLYELLRQAAPAFRRPPAAREEERHGIVRAENFRADLADARGYDPTPITLAFTFPGLAALQIDGTTLASFPDVFRQGMAARAQRLQDLGPSAPEFWEGELGLPSVHGYFTGGFGEPRPAKEAFWRALRADIRAFNEPASQRGQELRLWIGLLFRMLGMEIVQIELGQNPYEEFRGNVTALDHRLEHFGFRDGLSQPFVDMGLGDPPAGGATPSRNSTWTPVAPGEIFLNLSDEGGELQLAPDNPALRAGATYLVFRKLEQDVIGLRNFLDEQRPDDGEEQQALAARFVGRWKNGAPLVLSPRTERDLGSEAALNDFRYLADDPDGGKCPLGAHVRRTNPRDTGGRHEVSRHRILRRGISYGGPLLPEDAPDDGEPRGLLFIAANARIDLQFEVIQADWINGGELLGEAGLGRCPVTGARTGGGEDSFLEPHAVAPVTNLPRFVTTKGGDYFYAPGIGAIRDLADGKTFPAVDADVPFAGFSMGDAATPSLFSEDRITRYIGETLGGRRVIRVAPFNTASPEVVAFVGRHADVAEVLRNDPAPDPKAKCPVFSVSPYADASELMTRGDLMLIATEGQGPTADTRRRMRLSLNLAWRTLNHASGGKLYKRVRAAARSRLDMALRRTGPTKRVDLVDDLAAQAAYGVLTDIFGTPGPDWLTELAMSLPFARQHVGDLPRDWLAAARGEAPADPGFTSMQIWSALMVLDLIGNLQALQPLHALSRQAASELLAHIDSKIAEARALAADPGGSARGPMTLIEAFVKNEKSPAIVRAYGDDLDKLYYKEVSLILLEIIGSTLAVIPLTFASALQTLLKFRVDLTTLLPLIGDPGVQRLIYEGERLNANIPVRMRRCTAGTTLKKGGRIEAEDLVAALVAGANIDPEVFEDPMRLSLAGLPPVDPKAPGRFDGPPRATKDYLMFGVSGSHKECWGRDKVAMPVLEECLWTAGRLQGLRRIAGAAGEPAKLAGGVTVGLAARFTRVVAPLIRP
ncbi:hypothetical protein [Phenylobacterium sp.]|uniref:hypothetical protein n=1 Tax=Phenylobacterium sp. TaxID=1871053 RepID=UPI0035699086